MLDSIYNIQIVTLTLYRRNGWCVVRLNQTDSLFYFYCNKCVVVMH